MAAYNGDTPDVISIFADGAISGRALGVDLLGFSASYFQMQADDHTSTATCSWVAQGSPDATATSAAAIAAIAAAGLTTPVRNIRVVTRWTC